MTDASKLEAENRALRAALRELRDAHNAYQLARSTGTSDEIEPHWETLIEALMTADFMLRESSIHPASQQ